MSSILKYITDKDCRFRVKAMHGFYDSMPDEEYIRHMFRAKLGYDLNLDDPKTLNEKLQWIKLYDRKELYTKLVDKYEAKQYVADIIGSEYIIPTLGVWDDAKKIDFDSLPDQFVMKCTHDSHKVIICKDKEQLDTAKARKTMAEALKRDYYLKYREWAYKDVPRRIIAEKYMEDDSGFLTDYKFYCFHGKADAVLTCYDRMEGDTKFYFFDRNWQLKRYNKQGKAAPEGFTKPKPQGIDKMFDLAETLAEVSEAPFIRVDLYNVSGKIYFGELTLYPAAGFDKGRLPETDLLFGEMIDLKTIRCQ